MEPLITKKQPLHLQLQGSFCLWATLHCNVIFQWLGPHLKVSLTNNFGTHVDVTLV